MIRCVSDGQEALRLLRQCTADKFPSMILLDYQMPGLTAAEVLAEMARDSRFDNILKIVWSTSGHSNYRHPCLQSGARHYLTKPADLEGFARIARFIGSLLTHPGPAGKSPDGPHQGNDIAHGHQIAVGCHSLNTIDDQPSG